MHCPALSEVYVVLLTLRIYMTWFVNINTYKQPFSTLARMTDPYPRIHFTGSFGVLFLLYNVRKRTNSARERCCRFHEGKLRRQQGRLLSKFQLSRHLEGTCEFFAE